MSKIVIPEIGDGTQKQITLTLSGPLTSTESRQLSAHLNSLLAFYNTEFRRSDGATLASRKFSAKAIKHPQSDG